VRATTREITVSALARKAGSESPTLGSVNGRAGAAHGLAVSVASRAAAQRTRLFYLPVEPTLIAEIGTDVATDEPCDRPRHRATLVRPHDHLPRV
jgi:hypothetical protein